jgi:hypothetical protein
MTPIEIEAALFYYYDGSGRDYTDQRGKQNPSHYEAVNKLRALNLIDEKAIHNGAKYKATPKLEAYINRLCDIPLPIKKEFWVYPDKE